MAEDREDMPQADPQPDAAPEETPRARRRVHGWQLWLAGLALLILAGVAGGLVWIDSPAGHRFVVRQVEQLSPRSGLRIGIGRIEGSLFRKARVHDLRLYDPKGLFFSSPEIRLDWSPLGWLSNRLDIDELIVPQARLHKMPQFNKTEGTGKILPDFDIRIMRLKVDRFAVDEAVAGRADIFALEGDADVRGGQAVVDLSMRSVQGDDRLVLALDSRPDDNRFNIDLTVNAKAGGLISTMAGLSQDANVRLEGKGDWTRWDGRLIATLDRKSAAGLDIGLRKGDWKIEGTIAGSAIANDGLLARLTSPQLSINAQGRFENKLLSGAFRARSDAIAVDMKGGVHLGGRGYDNLLIDVGLNKPQALLKSFDARGLVARLRLNGPFSTARFEYLLRADQLRFGKTMLRGVHAAGDGRAGGTNGTTLIPLQLSAKSVEGQGDMVASILRNVSIAGTLQKNGSIITSSPMRLRSDKLDGQVVALFDLSTGRYDLALGGDLRGLLIPGFGVVDVHSQVKAVPDRKGGFSLAGRVDASMRRLDVGFLRTIAGGLPKMRTDIALGADGRLVFHNLLLNAPALTLRGEGVRNSDGTVHLTGAGDHSQYGPLRLVLDGDIARPQVDLLLARPLDAAGLADVHVLLDPEGRDYRIQADGQSYLGPFSALGGIEMPPGGETILAIEPLTVNGSKGQGRLRVVDGGLEGRLDFEGSVRGPIDLSVVGGVQKAKAALLIRQAHFPAATSIDIARGRLDADLSLDPEGTTIAAKLVGNGIQVGTMRINRITAETRLVNGEGTLTANVIGQRGRLFNMQVDADIAADEIGFALTGTLDRQKISLDRKGRLRRVEGGWALDPLTIHYRGGKAIINRAAFGSETALDVGVQNLSLSLLDLSNVDLGLSGTASGRIIYGWNGESGTRGSASIKVKGLSRSGVTRTSTPVDIGLNAELTDARMAMRALISQDGKIIGKAQAQMTPLGEGGLMERLSAAPIRAQLRYVGPASSLWRLSTIEIIDLSGQVAVTANISGTGANPVIEGALMTRDAVLESPITGMRLTKLQTSGRFNGSRLVLSQISGSTGDDGTVTGRGVFDLGLGQGVGINIALQANKALLLDRDDIGATVTGPVAIRSRDGVNGVISGDLDVVRSRFTLGRAAAVAEIPELRVIEKNRRGDVFEQAPRGAGWLLDIKANARNRLTVSGMGLSSEWRMDLTVGGQVTAPKIVGRADLIRGTYDFASRRFDLSEGALRFDGSVPANPTLDIKAQASLSDLDATIDIGGTSLNPEITFSSTPSLPEDEILSRILFGSSITSLSAPEALQLAAAVGSLQGGGGGLDPINAVRKAAGLDRLRILPADPTTGQGTSIGVGKYLTRKIYVELITDGQGYSATQLEYQITRWLSLLSAVSTLGRQSITARASKDY
ncbi:MAG: translocation/assembly module TamB domain-containing protein [Sphingobium sp.]